ncbi:MAG: hypothetical protein KDB65_01685 [Calditrichaeota bacterium]|nr:hypothetical protein [Calditrichota bacterium]
MKRWPLIVLSLFFATAAHADTTFVSGTVGGVWDLSGNPYIVQGSPLIPADSTLEIQRGVRIEFQGPFAFIVQGIMNCLGDIGDSIYFTQDTVDFPDRWQGLRFSSVDQPSLMRCVVAEFGGSYNGTIRVTDSQLTLEHATVRNCAIQSFNVDGGQVVLSDCHFADNGVQGGCGGSLRAQDATISLQNCRFERSGALDGAGLCVYRTSLTAYSCTFDHNEGAIWGGTIYADDSDLDFRNCIFESNAAIMGAATYIIGESSTIFERCVFARNHAVRNGTEGTYGALFLPANGPHRISNCLFYRNVGMNNGAIFANGIVTIEQSVFVENTDNPIIGGSPDSVRYNAFHVRPPSLSGMPSGFGILTETNGNGDSTDIYGNFFSDPGFDPAGQYGEFSLSFDSHLRDAGNPNGTPDPDGTIPDLGPYPYFWLQAIDDLTLYRVGESLDINLRWSSIPEAVEYRVYRTSGGEFDWDAAYYVGTTDSAGFLHQNAFSDTQNSYTYIVIAFDSHQAITWQIPEHVRHITSDSDPAFFGN